jgi:hypothetical protein
MSGSTFVGNVPNVFGLLGVQDIPHQLMGDEFDSSAAMDVINNWSAPVVGNSAVVASTSAGVLSLGTGTTASGYSYVLSRPNFRSTTPGWIRYAFNIALADGAAPISNAYRFWGAGTPNGTPTTVAPVLNGVGFELTVGGHLCCVIYNNGVRTQVADLTAAGAPLDGLTHNYQVYYRPTRIYWFTDDQVNPVAVSSLAQSALNVDTVPVMYLAVGGSTPPGSSAVLASNAMSVSDTAKNHVTLADGVYPFRKLAIQSTGALSTSIVDGSKNTYTAGVVGLAATNVGVVFTLTGSATKTIRITRVSISCLTGGATATTIYLSLRSSAATGGTPNGTTMAPVDTGDPAVSATSNSYTAAPTPGSLRAIVGTDSWQTAGAGSVSSNWVFGDRPAQCPVLRGTAQEFEISNQVAIGTSGSWSIVVEFTEE